MSFSAYTYIFYLCIYISLSSYTNIILIPTVILITIYTLFLHTHIIILIENLSICQIWLPLKLFVGGDLYIPPPQKTTSPNFFVKKV